jgi:glycosyltransferase involved in cell wall biosynthesis
MKKPLLSICLRTYNNQEFVLEALEGMFKQKVNFDLEFIYSDDCSKDNSFELVQNAIKDSDQFVNVHLKKQPKNLGMIDNLLYLLNNCKGDYIAMCDGDDYWSDPEKSQIQIDFLEANPDYEVCFTNVCTIQEDGKILKEKLINDGRRTDYEMKHLPTWVPVSTKIFRNRDFNSLSRTVPGDDMYMLLYQSKLGKIKFLDIVTGAYRYQSRGTYSSLEVSKRKDYELKTHMECMELVTADLYPKYQNLIIKKIVELRYLDKKLYLERLLDLKSFMKKYTNRFSKWEAIKMNVIIGVLRVLDLVGIKGGKNLMLRVINKII